MALKDEYLTVSQAARELGVTRQTISRWIAKKYVPVERVGRFALIKKKDLQKYHHWRLSEAAANSIVALAAATIADVFREEGRIKQGSHVRFAEARDKNIMKMSDEEKAKVNKTMQPIVVEILKELDSKVKDEFRKHRQRINRQRRGKSK